MFALPSKTSIPRPTDYVSLFMRGCIDSRGIVDVAAEAVRDLEQRCDAFLLSFDVDACEGSSFPACAAPEVGGLTAREANAVFRIAGESPRLVGADIVEYVPEKDTNGVTGRLILNLIDALVGWRITG